MVDRRAASASRRGAIAVLSVFFMVMMLLFTALAVDFGYVMVLRTELQSAADSSALAAAAAYSDSGSGVVDSIAVAYATQNMPNRGNVLKAEDVDLGTWDAKTKTFTAGGAAPNAVRVTTRAAESNANAVPYFFGRVFGYASSDVSATAVALVPTNGPSFRFLLDDELIDKDVPSIEDLADDLNIDPENLISDKNKDGFIDLPGGVQLEVPTGQNGDEGMFDMSESHGSFPFRESTPYTHRDFLAEGTALESIHGTQNLQDVEWDGVTAPLPSMIGKKVLDPVPGTPPMHVKSKIMDLPDANQVYVSPLFKSDISTAEKDPGKYGAVASNLQGERRGLVAFKIISAKSNPAGGKYLPLLTIEIVAPSSINWNQITLGSGSSSPPRLVQ
jgi:Flp pilus assembly protein TadG